ncbi:hypothetical protein MMC08_004556 [Hypocenomyce scalaris]|nr:hypothetical protein [Hypocenomyce scalaris]
MDILGFRSTARLCRLSRLPTRGRLQPSSRGAGQHTRGIASVASVQELPSAHELPLPPSRTPPSLPEETQPRQRDTLKDAKPFSAFLTDNFSRQHDYLRISITERCNLRCVYCMPEEGVPLSPPSHLLTTPEITYLSSLFVSQGVTKIRLTGGEPTIRRDILPLMHDIGALRRNGLKELCLTTNGISLHRKLDSMAEAGLTGVNLSLDTLDPFQFQIMTRRKGFDAVMKSIERILEMNKLGAGIKLKINCVVMRGINEREIIPFVEMCREKDVEVRFIEYMPFDGNKWSQQKMLSYQEMLEIIREKYPDLRKVSGHKNDTSKTFEIPGFRGRLGFITSMTHNFCGTCNRLRITSEGNLKVCLFGNDEVSLRDLLRQDNGGAPIDQEAMEALKRVEMDRRQAVPGSTGALGYGRRERELLDVIGMAVKRKKEKHAGMGELENMKNRPMILIGEAPVAPMMSHRRPSAPTLNTINRSISATPRIPYHLLPPTAPHHLRLYFTSREPTDDLPPTSRTPAPTSTPASLPHLTPTSEVHMTRITDKPTTHRVATAVGYVSFSTQRPLRLIRQHALQKGDVLAVARVAGIMAAKKCADWIPLCHPGIGITGVSVEVEPVDGPQAAAPSRPQRQRGKSGGWGDFGGVRIEATVECVGVTGVEMEALTAVVGAALSVVDMCKAVDRGCMVEACRVVRKEGGRSGSWREDGWGGSG